MIISAGGLGSALRFYFCLSLLAASAAALKKKGLGFRVRVLTLRCGSSTPRDKT